MKFVTSKSFVTSILVIATIFLVQSDNTQAQEDTPEMVPTFKNINEKAQGAVKDLQYLNKNFVLTKNGLAKHSAEVKRLVSKQEKLEAILARSESHRKTIREHMEAGAPMVVDGKTYSLVELKRNLENIDRKTGEMGIEKKKLEIKIEDHQLACEQMVTSLHKLTEAREALYTTLVQFQTSSARWKTYELNQDEANMLAATDVTLTIMKHELEQLAKLDKLPQEEQWTQLFNGKDLEGWTPKIRGYDLGENFGDTFRVEDGLLKVNYEAYTDGYNQRFGHLFYKDKFSHYILRIEYRFVGEQVEGGPGWAKRNSGVMLHCQDPATIGKDQNFPVSIEMQMLGGDGTNDRTNANVCTPGTHIEMGGKLITKHCVSATSETYHGEQWVTIEVEVRGDEVIRHKIGDDVVLEYQKPQLDPKDGDAAKLVKDDKVELKEGFISLQSESHPIEFRKIEIKILEK